MSAGFCYAGTVYWGTNGAIELCLERLAEALGDGRPDDAPLRAFLQECRETFFMGAVLDLDDALADDASRARFVEVLGVAMTRMIGDDGLSAYGREWVGAELAELRDAIARMPPARG